MPGVRVIHATAQTHKVGIELPVYVGRPTKLGNPFRMKKESDRNKVIDNYEVWLRGRMKWASPERKEIMNLVGTIHQGTSIALRCWCAPKRCHADVIKKIIEEQLEQTQNEKR